jgi:serine/threonine-protein kinase
MRFCATCGRSLPILDTPTLEPDTIAVVPKPATPGSRPPASGGFSPGTLLVERYRIVSLLGRGGMGEVYRAEDLKLGNVVALKFLPASLKNDAAALAGFHAEVRNARQISHPNVCRVYDIGEVNGQHFLTMEYIDGEDLASLLRRIGRLPADKALETAHQICAGLAAAHDCGLLHRDLKPANIMLDGRGRVRLTDFGLALSSADATARSETAGTPAYMAPEQIGKGEASVRSDIYSLGLVFYELFTGRLPYQATTPIEWRRAHLESSPRTPSSVVKDIDPVVEKAILRCLQKDPAQRPSSVRQVAAAFLRAHWPLDQSRAHAAVSTDRRRTGASRAFHCFVAFDGSGRRSARPKEPAPWPGRPPWSFSSGSFWFRGLGGGGLLRRASRPELRQT